MAHGRRSATGFIVVLVLIGSALLALAVPPWRDQMTRDREFAAHGVTTTAVIGGISRGASTAGTAYFSEYANVSFTAGGRAARARVTLAAACARTCGKPYRDGGTLLITYDSRNPADAVLGHYTAPPAHLGDAGELVAFAAICLIPAAALLLVSAGQRFRAARGTTRPR